MTLTKKSWSDRAVRVLQNALGPQATRFALALCGPAGRQFARKALRRKARHRLEASVLTAEIGSGSAPWTIAPAWLTPESIIYSVGIGKDISFDATLIERYGAQVFAFDPTPESVQWCRAQRFPERFHPFEFGVADFDGLASFRQIDGTMFQLQRSNGDGPLPVKRLATIMRELDHDHIDILKLDIEGAEYEVLADVLASQLKVHQILVEFHHRFPGYSVQQTEKLVKLLNQQGYAIFAIAESGREYSFIKQ